MVRGRDACWEHCVLVDATRQKVRCNYCQREFSGGVYRMKFHLAQIKNKDIVPCTEVPDEVRDLIQNILSTPKKQKNPKKPKLDMSVNGTQQSSFASDGFHPNPGSSGQHGSTCQAFLFPPSSPSAQETMDDPQKKKHDDADKKIALFFFHNSIPFSASRSMYYQEMMDAVAECDVGYVAPSYEKLRSYLLEKVKGEVNDNYNRFRYEWKNTEAMVKMITKDKDKIEFTKEHPMYINAHGALGSEFAILGRTLNAPGDWWAGTTITLLDYITLNIQNLIYDKQFNKVSSIELY
ncbi:hAT transposon superfamily [Thalictrum thalictroides]|uniref:HAT transposon superfamily n=1 Tax=Thalictrum thalictroides TaxID=46969 RepID=A0A7J6XCE6_THATH|nr:hAT transposon superfamily [Thalictrum thalictroides]